MRITAKSALVRFWANRPEAEDPMQAWYKVATNCKAKDFSELKQTFGSADYVPSKYTVFDVGGSKYRIVCVVYYNTQRMYIRGVFTHKEYDQWTKQNRGK